tara:strand:+ start:396 stop:776 length:381 start_codon:yes stop_codon:yes gene_type:complete
MKIFVLLYNANSENEGIHSIEFKGKTIVLMFEERDDAERYCGLLEAQDFPIPSVESIEISEIKEFCKQCDYETRLVERNFIPKTEEDRLLLTPPQKNIDIENWNSNQHKESSFDIDSIKENLEKLL